MSDKMEIDFRSWNTAAGAFDGVAGRAPASIDAVVSGTTDPSACGAAGGLATVDGAVAIMLQVFGQIMSGTVVPSLRSGLASEADALSDTGKALRAAEDVNAAEANTIEVD